MNILKSSIIYSFFTSISRIFGFLRDMFIANFLGTGIFADIFFVAFRFPNTFRRIFSEGALNSAFVPIYTKLSKDNLFKETRLFAGNILLIFFIVTSFLVLLIEIFMPYFVLLIAPGFSSEQDKYLKLVNIARIIFPFLILISISSILSSILNSNNKFAVSAALPILLNITLIMSLIIAHYIAGDYLLFLSWSVVVAGCLQVLLLFIALQREKIFINFSIQIMTKYIKRFGKLFSASFFSSGLLQINILIGTVIASYESGAISYLYYADRIYQLPLALIGIAIGITLLPSISSQIQTESKLKIKYSIQETIIFAILFSLPAAVGIFTLSNQIVEVLFQRGEFNEISTTLTANALNYFCLGLVAFIIMKIYTPIFFAYENAKPTLHVTAINLLLNTLLSVILFMYIGFLGIAIATSVSAWISVFILHYYLKKFDYFNFTSAIFFPLLIIIIVSSIMFFYLHFLKLYAETISNYLHINDIIFLLFSVLSSILLYLILISFYKPFSYREIIKTIKK